MKEYSCERLDCEDLTSWCNEKMEDKGIICVQGSRDLCGKVVGQIGSNLNKWRWIVVCLW